MKTGIVFDIREFTIHDGPGIRTTVFMKGCPLRCAWCHNPEGLSPDPQILANALGEERVSGRRYTSGELAGLLNRQAAILDGAGGGITFSGGEPLMQTPFVAEVIDRLERAHVLLDTSGYGGEEDFKSLLDKSDMMYFDLKLASSDEHALWTGEGNEIVLRNLRLLADSAPPFVIRIPLVPGVTDTTANLSGIAGIIGSLPRAPEEVHLLPYNRAAGGKYGGCGMRFVPGFDEDREPASDRAVFENRGITVKIL